MASVTLNGGPYDGKIVEQCTSGEEPDGGPVLYCGMMGDGFIRIYRKQSPGQYIYEKTVPANELKDES
ncbi:hypothetical protein C4577_04965 [Candidatus Parcubacteria bacterium]|nr:MAG: hypothetical protein C4577_04965 [Candidatus Parcubacteria bacterium]